MLVLNFTLVINSFSALAKSTQNPSASAEMSVLESSPENTISDKNVTKRSQSLHAIHVSSYQGVKRSVSDRNSGDTQSKTNHNNLFSAAIIVVFYVTMFNFVFFMLFAEQWDVEYRFFWINSRRCFQNKRSPLDIYQNYESLTDDHIDFGDFLTLAHLLF